ncbi:hypothetical protein QOT17_015914 [Balamuthia mandrillaris]
MQGPKKALPSSFAIGGRSRTLVLRKAEDGSLEVSSSSSSSSSSSPSSSQAESKFSLARIQLPDTAATPNFTQWAKPLLMYREEKTDEEGNSVPLSFARRGVLPPHVFKGMPLILQDAVGKQSFVGKIEGAQTSNYFLCALEGDELKVYPSGDWYNFKPKRTYKTLSLEEAEAQLKSHQKKIDRWLMKQGKGENGKDDTEKPERSGLIDRSYDSDEEGKKLAKKKTNEELDFAESFDDDEEHDQAVEMEKSGKLTKTGKQLKNLLKNLGGEDTEHQSSDEEIEDEEEETEVREDSEKKGMSPTKTTTPAESPTEAAVTATDTGTITKTTAETTLQQPTKGTKRKPASTNVTEDKTATKKTKTEEKAITPKEEKPTEISEEAVKQELRKGHIKTAALIERFKALLTDAARKGEFMQIVKKVAEITEVPAGSGNKFLTLKAEYRA